MENGGNNTCEAFPAHVAAQGMVALMARPAFKVLLPQSRVVTEAQTQTQTQTQEVS